MSPLAYSQYVPTCTELSSKNKLDCFVAPWTFVQKASFSSMAWYFGALLHGFGLLIRCLYRNIARACLCHRQFLPEILLIRVNLWCYIAVTSPFVCNNSAFDAVAVNNRFSCELIEMDC